MPPDLIIPDACVPFIRWQRSRFIKAKVPDDEEVKRRYAAWVAEDFAGMEPHLPAHVDSILEIGCGMAAIEVFLKRKYPGAHLSLLDGTGENIVEKGAPAETGKGGWQDTLAPYNSRAHTEMLLEANGVTVDRWIDIGTKESLAADMVLSMASWGYHYPLSTYKTAGLHIVDLRRGREKSRGKVIFVGPKYDRCMWQQP
ncbi:MAG: hypothetical protein NUV34_01085 [Sulfuricaulis sp.]|nr:hypothetical protein [Sulfuricaulis sp.]